MALAVEVNLKNGTSNSVEVNSVVGYIPVALTVAEEANMATVVSELNAIDITNSGWLAISNVATEVEKMNIKSSAIAEEVTAYDKGCLANNDDTNAITQLIDSILTRRFVVSANIFGWVIIRKRNAINFLLEIVIADIFNQVDIFDITFTAFDTTPPIPMEFLNEPVSVPAPNIKIYSSEVLEFEDAMTAVGQGVDISIVFKDYMENIIDSTSVNVIVQDI